MKYIFTTIALTLTCFSITLFFACNKDKTKDLSYGINPVNDPDLVNKALRLPGKLVDGSLPTSDIASGGVAIVSWPEAIEVNGGVDVYIPYTTNNDKNIQKLFVQVQGAESYWEIPVGHDTMYSNLYMKLFIPNLVKEDSFNLIFSVADNQGKISSAVQTNTIISSPLSCGATAKGSVGITVRVIDLGENPGLVTLYYNTYSIPDRIDLQYGGDWIRSTGPIFPSYHPDCGNYNMGTNAGFVSGTGVLKFDHDPANGRYLNVYITGCDNSTVWDIQVDCPKGGMWYEELPDCPCTWEKVQLLDGKPDPVKKGEWYTCLGLVSLYFPFHYGSENEARWFPDIPGNAGQQCTYDNLGQLITSGIAAGSPDIVSPMSCDLPPNTNDHIINDVNPWKVIPCTEYLAKWKANSGSICGAPNPKNDITHIQKLVSNMTCEEIVYLYLAIDESSNASANFRKYIHGEAGYINLSEAEIVLQLQLLKSEYDCSVNVNSRCSAISTALGNLQ